MNHKRVKLCNEPVKQEIPDVLEDSRTSLLFPKVFECLVKLNERNKKYFNVEPEKHQKAFVGDKVWNFPLGLRLVCSHWNNSIEQYYQKTHYPLINKQRVLQIHGKDTTEVDSQIKFFCKFGQEVESINIEIINFYDNTVVGLYSLIQQLLKNLKMLKRLWINYETTKQNYYNHIEQFEATIKLHPCPNFQKLETLEVKGWLSNQIIHELLKKSNNLTCFKQSQPGDYYIGFNYSSISSSLTDLNIKIENNSDFQQFKQFGKTWKLRKFVGNFLHLLDRKNWLDIFQVLGDNWSKSLEELGIMLPRMLHRPNFKEDMLKYTLKNQLDLHKLKTFVIWTTTPISLDFLIPCRGSLESISIRWSGHPKELDEPTKIYYDAMDQQFIEHLGSESDMGKSNIWRSFINLRVVKSIGEVVCRPAKYGPPAEFR